MWDRPVQMAKLVLAPAERAEVLVDFTKLAGRSRAAAEQQARTARVDARPPADARDADPGGHGGDESWTGHDSHQLPGRAANLPTASRTRYITLNEVAPESWPTGS